MSKPRRVLTIAAAPVARPDVFGFYNYRGFLNVWLKYLKETQPGFSLKSLALKSGLAVSYLSMVTNKQRNLSLESWSKLAPNLSLSEEEQGYLESLIRFSQAGTQEARLRIFDQMKRFPSYRKRNPNETKFVEYMSQWHHIAIREMAGLPDFKLDPAWIQNRLSFPISIPEISAAIQFLIKTGYLVVREDGSIEPPQEQYDFVGEAYWAALTQYHRQMFSLAAESIDVTPAERRNLAGYSFVVDDRMVERAQSILEKALKEIKALELQPDQPGRAVYHVELALFPLTKTGPGDAV